MYTVVYPLWTQTASDPASDVGPPTGHGPLLAFPFFKKILEPGKHSHLYKPFGFFSTVCHKSSGISTSLSVGHHPFQMSKTHSRNVLESLSTIARGLNYVSQGSASISPNCPMSRLIFLPSWFSILRILRHTVLVSIDKCRLGAAAIWTHNSSPLFTLPSTSPVRIC